MLDSQTVFIKLCQLIECFDEDNVLKNNRNTDVKIEKLQKVVEDYIRRSKKQ